MQPSTFLLLRFLFLSSIARRTTASSFGFDNVLDTSLIRRCGSTLGPCGDGNCQGVNYVFPGAGQCFGGAYAGCACALSCDNYLGPCDDEVNCYGVSDPSGSGGYCQKGWYAGCPCQRVCGDVPGDCDNSDCEGINLPGGNLGYCTTSTYQGCLCNSVCTDFDGDCDSCDGDDGTCMEGPYTGCTCDSDCGNYSNQPCNISGCNGYNFPDLGFGICLGNFQGCACIMTCTSTNGLCSSLNCVGSNGVCTSGDYKGCYCDYAIAIS